MEKIEGKNISFGRVLTAVRMEKGLDLNQVSAAIKINQRVLQDLENEEHSKLPDDVYVKGFIRAYSDLLELDPGEMVKLYQESLTRYQNVLRKEAELVGYNPKFWTKFAGAFILMLLIVGFSIYLMPVTDNAPAVVEETTEIVETVAEPTQPDPEPEKVAVAEEVPAVEIKDENISEVPDEAPLQAEDENLKEETEEDAPEIVQEEPVSLEDDAEENVEDEVAQTEKEADTTPLYLKLHAIEETWVKIITDKEKPREFILKTGDLKELKGQNKFNLLIGNAGGVHVFLNDKPVEIDGKSGQVVTLMLP